MGVENFKTFGRVHNQISISDWKEIQVKDIRVPYSNTDIRARLMLELLLHMQEEWFEMDYCEIGRREKGGYSNHFRANFEKKNVSYAGYHRYTKRTGICYFIRKYSFMILLQLVKLS